MKFEEKKKLITELLMVANGVKEEDFDKEYKILYVVEGHSAASGIRSKRNAKVHGILALRGKILNVWGLSLNKAMASDIVKEFLTVTNNTNYNKIVIVTDADDDGAHISTLMMGLIYKFASCIIDQNKLAICDTPLYTFRVNNKTVAWGGEKVLDINTIERVGNKKAVKPKTNDEKEIERYQKESGIETIVNKGLGSYTMKEIPTFILYPSMGASYTTVVADDTARYALEGALKRGAVEWTVIDPDADHYGYIANSKDLNNI